ncbi:methyltransferase domain-containing protein [uncultured Desulfovibrio sp.]|uniref:class I SAM-dependent methyltransferase n=1 Tax=uncultured Desulfovibrio sp. TaxID=167968 RepID=UPI0025856542|nr:methyltransferase domain-containing protein [uncultured Desulfovibrio sp.]
MDLMELALWDASRANADACGDGAKIPWDEPDFSRRMLENHLNQEHDWASRRGSIIASHVAWIAEQLSRPSRILDMGCGPGLYTQALAERKHHCVGVDFSPASIDYARQQGARCDPKPKYILEDIRNYRSNQKFDCIIMTFGEFNTFIRQDAAIILENCAHMLRENGLLIMETHTYDAVRAIGEAPATWLRYATGLFSAKPHLCLRENSWNDADASALSRYFIIDAASAAVRQYASFMQAYHFETYVKMLSAAALPLQRILSEKVWSCGQDFCNKLQTFLCRKI